MSQSKKNSDLLTEVLKHWEQTLESTLIITTHSHQSTSINNQIETIPRIEFVKLEGSSQNLNKRGKE